MREDLSKGGAGLRLKSPPKRTLRVPEKIIITPPGGSSLTYTLTGVSDTMEKWRSPKPEAGSPEVEYDLRSRSPSPTQDGSPPPPGSPPRATDSPTLSLSPRISPCDAGLATHVQKTPLPEAPETKTGPRGQPRDESEADERCQLCPQTYQGRSALLDHLNESHREHKFEAGLLEQMKARICDECTTFYDLHTAHKCRSSDLDCGEEERTHPRSPIPWIMSDSSSTTNARNAMNSIIHSVPHPGLRADTSNSENSIGNLLAELRGTDRPRTPLPSFPQNLPQDEKTEEIGEEVREIGEEVQRRCCLSCGGWFTNERRLVDHLNSSHRNEPLDEEMMEIEKCAKCELWLTIHSAHSTQECEEETALLNKGLESPLISQGPTARKKRQAKTRGRNEPELIISASTPQSEKSLPQQLLTDRKDIDQEGPRRCHSCTSSFSSKTELRNHSCRGRNASRRRKDQPLKCGLKECKEVSKSPKEAAKHLNAAHKGEKLSLPEMARLGIQACDGCRLYFVRVAKHLASGKCDDKGQTEPGNAQDNKSTEDQMMDVDQKAPESNDFKEPFEGKYEEKAPAQGQDKEDNDTLFDLDWETLGHSPRLWRSIPADLVGLWRAICRPRFRKVILAHRGNDREEMEKAIERVLNIPTVVLRRVRGGRGHERGVRMLKAQLQSGLVRASNPPEYQKPSEAADEEEAERTRRIGKSVSLVYEGHARRAILSLSRKGVAKMDGARFDKLKRLHPDGSKTDLPALPRDAPLMVQVDRENLAAIVRKMANGAAPGRSGWTGSLLAAIVEDQECLDGLAAITSWIVNGRLAGKVKRKLLTSVLVGIDKPDGGIRPIAIGETFYKMAVLYALAVNDKETKDALGPRQFAAAPGGSETAVNFIQTAMDLFPDWAVISVDIANAFNARSRKDILDELYRRKPLSGLWKLANWAYGQPSELCVMEDGKVWKTLSSSEGVRQGDALSSFLFALSMVNIYNDTTKETECLFAAVQDDYYILGPTEHATIAWEKFCSLCKSTTGLKINRSKSQILLPAGSEGKELANEGLILRNDWIPALGTILTRNDKTAEKWLVEESKKKHDKMFELLMDKKMPAQVAYILLRMSMVPSINFWLRTSNPSRTAKLAEEFDQKLLAAMTAILDLPHLEEVARKQLVMPISKGGFGIRSASLTAKPAWISAMAQSMRANYSLLVRGEHPRGKWVKNVEKTTNALKDLKMKTHLPIDGKVFWETFGQHPAEPGLQREITEAVLGEEQGKIFKKAERSDTDYARMVGLQCKESGLWLTAMPIHTLLRMRDVSFQLAAKARLGVSLSTGTKSCACGVELESNPLHLLSCRHLVATMNLRHNKVLSTLLAIAGMTLVTARKEVTVEGDGRKRTDGLFVVKGKATMIDVSIICPTAKTYVKAGRKSLGAAQIREKQKIEKYDKEVKNHGMDFIPFVVETTGGMGGKAKRLIDQLMDEALANNATSFVPDRVDLFIKRAVAVAVQIGNGMVAQEGIRRARGRKWKGAVSEVRGKVKKKARRGAPVAGSKST